MMRLRVPVSTAATAAFNARHRYCSLVKRWQTTTAGTTTAVDEKGGYQSIGSFHSENLAELMKQSDDEYQPPQLPFSLTDDVHASEAATNHKTGDIRNDFMIDFDNWTFLNHGAFGAALKVGYDRAAQWRLHTERQPLRYFDRDLLPHLAYSARCLAGMMKAPNRANVTLLPNVTAGMNAVVAGHGRRFNRDRTLRVVWDMSYGSVKKIAYHSYAEAEDDTGSLEIPFLQKRYLDRLASNTSHPDDVFQEALEDFCCGDDESWLEGSNICFILDQTTSNTALTLPIEKLAAQMKSRFGPDKVVVVVDGAHGLVAQDNNLTQLFQESTTDTSYSSLVDVYLTNGHKWFAAPRGVAFMAVSSKMQAGLLDRPNSNGNETYPHHRSLVRYPAVLSHGVDEHDLLSRYVWDGCRDYAAALAVPAICEYWKTFRRSGGPQVSNYDNLAAMRTGCKDTLRDGIQVLADHWHGGGARVDIGEWPGLVTLVDFESSVVSPMALVRLPKRLRSLGHMDNQGGNLTSTDAKKVQDYLYSRKIEVPVKCILGILYVRLSCHIYNRQEDFQRLAMAIDDVV